MGAIKSSRSIDHQVNEIGAILILLANKKDIKLTRDPVLRIATNFTLWTITLKRVTKVPNKWPRQVQGVLDHLREREEGTYQAKARDGGL